MDSPSTSSSLSNEIEAVRARIDRKRRNRSKISANRSLNTPTGNIDARVDAAQAGVPAPFTRAERLQNFVEQLRTSNQSASAQTSALPPAATEIVHKATSITGRLTRPDSMTPQGQAAATKSNQEIAEAIAVLDAARQKYASLVADKKVAPEQESYSDPSDMASTKEQLVASISAAIATVLTDLKLDSAIDQVDATRADVAFAEPEIETSAPIAKTPVAAPAIISSPPVAAPVAEVISATPPSVKPNTLEVVDSEVFNVGAFIPVDIAAWDVEKFVWPMIVDQFLDIGEQAISRLANFSMDILDGSQHRLAVTSVRSGAGASTIACSIARWSAQMKKRVLLVDANIQKPSLAASIGLAPNISWVNVIRESLNPAEAIIRCKSTGVCVMPLGDTTDRQVLPEKLLDHLGELLTSVQHSFDLIVLDTGEAQHLPLELSACGNLVDAAMIVDSNVASSPFRQAKEGLLKFGVTKFVAAQNSI